jgi:hypothetical protein
MWKFMETAGGYSFYHHSLMMVYNCCKAGEVFDYTTGGGYYSLFALKKLKGVL